MDNYQSCKQSEFHQPESLQDLAIDSLMQKLQE